MTYFQVKQLYVMFYVFSPPYLVVVYSWTLRSRRELDRWQRAETKQFDLKGSFSVFDCGIFRETHVGM